MGRPVAELQRDMSAIEFAHWKVRDSIEPIGGLRTDILNADIAFTIACSQWNGKGAGPDWEDFYRDWWKEVQEQQSPKDMHTMLMMWAGTGKKAEDG